MAAIFFSAANSLSTSENTLSTTTTTAATKL